MYLCLKHFRRKMRENSPMTMTPLHMALSSAVFLPESITMGSIKNGASIVYVEPGIPRHPTSRKLSKMARVLPDGVRSCLPVSPSQRRGDRSTSKSTNYGRLRRTACGVLFLKKFPGGPVATTLGFQCSGPEFNPCSGNWILRAAPRTQSNLINK